MDKKRFGAKLSSSLSFFIFLLCCFFVMPCNAVCPVYDDVRNNCISHNCTQPEQTNVQRFSCKNMCIADSKNVVDTCIAAENAERNRNNDRWTHYRTIILASVTAGIAIGVAAKDTFVATNRIIFYGLDAIIALFFVFCY